MSVEGDATIINPLESKKDSPSQPVYENGKIGHISEALKDPTKNEKSISNSNITMSQNSPVQASTNVNIVPLPPPTSLQATNSIEREVSPQGRYVKSETKLGSGAYKDVWRAYDTNEGIEVAWNVIKLSRVPPSERKRIKTEVQLLKDIEHPNIIRYHSSWVNRDREEIVFITEIMSSGSLKEYLTKNPMIRWYAVKSWCRQILAGLQFLHNKQIIHRDIKCDNIFINGSTGEIRIGDLGLSTKIAESRHLQFGKNNENSPEMDNNSKVAVAMTCLGTPEFMAPELYDENYDERVDIYAFGMSCIEMITAKTPYYDCTSAPQIYKKVLNGEMPPELEKVSNKNAKAFILLCLQPKDQRPPASELLKHPFLLENDVEDNQEVLVKLETVHETLETDEGDELANDENVKRTNPSVDDSLSIPFEMIRVNSKPPLDAESVGRIATPKPANMYPETKPIDKVVESPKDKKKDGPVQQPEPQQTKKSEHVSNNSLENIENLVAIYNENPDNNIRLEMNSSTSSSKNCDSSDGKKERSGHRFKLQGDGLLRARSGSSFDTALVDKSSFQHNGKAEGHQLTALPEDDHSSPNSPRKPLTASAYARGDLQEHLNEDLLEKLIFAGIVNIADFDQNSITITLRSTFETSKTSKEVVFEYNLLEDSPSSILEEMKSAEELKFLIPNSSEVEKLIETIDSAWKAASKSKSDLPKFLRICQEIAHLDRSRLDKKPVAELHRLAERILNENQIKIEPRKVAGSNMPKGLDRSHSQNAVDMLKSMSGGRTQSSQTRGASPSITSVVRMEEMLPVESPATPFTVIQDDYSAEEEELENISSKFNENLSRLEKDTIARISNLQKEKEKLEENLAKETERIALRRQDLDKQLNSMQDKFKLRMDELAARKSILQAHLVKLKENLLDSVDNKQEQHQALSEAATVANVEQSQNNPTQVLSPDVDNGSSIISSPAVDQDLKKEPATQLSGNDGTSSSDFIVPPVDS